MTDINDKLDILYDLLVDNFETFEIELKDLILNPLKIKNTNKFASLLSELKNSTFIKPLLLKISLSEIGDIWLIDFLYAVVNLLNESSIHDEFDIPEHLIDKLHVWILDYNGNIAWKAASLLKFYESEEAEEIQLKKLEQDDFFMTHSECILGLLRYNKEKHFPLVRKIAIDVTKDKNLREFCEDVIKNYR